MVNNNKLILFAFAALLCFVVKVSAQRPSDALPPSVIAYMSARPRRYHHYLWHNIRDSWNRLSESNKQQITNLGWAPPRPSRSYDANGRATQILDNDAGEDFLYMHRSMITRYNRLVRENNEPLGTLRGWTTVPGPDDRDYPVPPNYTIPNSPSTTEGTMIRKAPSFYNRTIRPLENTFKDPVELRKMTLGQFGARMEATIHSYMHMRWSSNSTYGFRPNGRGVLPDFDRRWDDPRYNWLGDSYASQCHPLFWKLHGWVDDRLEDWRRANGLSSIRWKGTWIGGPMSRISSVTSKIMAMNGESNGMEMDDDMDMDEMDDLMPKVMGILLSECAESSVGDEVIVDDFVPESKKWKPRKCKITKKKVL